MKFVPSLTIEEAINMDSTVVMKIFQAAASLKPKDDGASEGASVTRSANGVVKHHITSFDQLQAVVGGMQ